MNRITIIGNLTADPTSRVTQSGHNVTSFTVAVNRRHRVEGQPEADFFRVTCWDKLADLCKSSLSKGKKVAAIGSISSQTYQAQDGSIRASLELMANEVEFLTPRDKLQEQASGNKYVQVDPNDLPWGN